MSLKEMRDQLREIRKETMKPVSRMKKADLASELEKCKAKREETPPVSSVKSAKPMMQVAKIKDVKKAKESEFPTKPVDMDMGKTDKKKGMPKTVVADKMSKKDKLKAMLEAMSDDE